MEWFKLTPEKYKKLFMSYSSQFDCCELVDKYAQKKVHPHPSLLTNFLGAVVSPSYFGDLLKGKEGTVEGIPLPGNWHACVAEWGACLRSLDLADQRQKVFTVVELGCGWGCWLNNMAVAARNKNMEYKLVGIEGDPHHLEFAKETFKNNNISSDAFTLHRGIAAATEGIALFPTQKTSGKSWGLRPLFSVSAEKQESEVRSGRYSSLPMISLPALCREYSRIDLLHIDIQGGEGDLIGGSLTSLVEHVAYMFIGTHSRKLEKSIKHALANHPWELEIERPAIYKMQISGPKLKVDGVQGWRNKNLLPDID